MASASGRLSASSSPQSSPVLGAQAGGPPRPSFQGSLSGRDVQRLADDGANFAADASGVNAGAYVQSSVGGAGGSGKPFISRRTVGERVREYKKTCIVAATLITLVGIFVAVYLGSSSAHSWLNDNIFNPLHSKLGTGGGIALASILGAIALRYMYRGANYLKNGVYIAERTKDDFDPTNIKYPEMGVKNSPAFNDRVTVGDRVKEKWLQITILSLIVMGAVVLPVVFTHVHGATTLWDEKLWPALNNHVFTPIHQHLGDVGGIMVGSAATLLAGNALYQLGKFIKTGKYLANVQIQSDGLSGYHSHTWFAVSESL